MNCNCIICRNNGAEWFYYLFGKNLETQEIQSWIKSNLGFTVSATTVNRHYETFEEYKEIVGNFDYSLIDYHQQTRNDLRRLGKYRGLKAKNQTKQAWLDALREFDQKQESVKRGIARWERSKFSDPFHKQAFLRAWTEKLHTPSDFELQHIQMMLKKQLLHIPSKSDLEDLFNNLNFPKWLEFDWLWRRYENQPIWATCLHEMGHFAVVPNWCIESDFSFDGFKDDIKNGAIPRRFPDYECPLSLKDVYLKIIQNSEDEDDLEFRTRRLQVFSRDLSPMPNEFAVRAWCLMVLDLKDWINPTAYGGFWNQWSDPVGDKPSPWYLNENPIGDGYAQLAYWGMNPGLRPFTNPL